MVAWAKRPAPERKGSLEPGSTFTRTETPVAGEAAADRADRREWPLLRDLVTRLSSFVLDAPFLAVFAAFVGVMLLMRGVGTYPGIGIEILVSRHLPLAPPNMAPPGHFLMSSLAGPVLARVLGVSSPFWFAALHLLVLVSGLWGVLHVVRRRRGDRAARLVLLMLACVSLPTILLQWLGSYDVFTFLLSSLLVVTGSAPGIVLMSFALGMQHFEQGAVMALMLAVVGSERFGRIRYGALMFAGLATARVVLFLYTRMIGVGDRMFWLSSSQPFPRGNIVVMWARHLPALLYSLLGGGWVLLALIVFVVGWGWPETRRSLLALALALVPTVLSHDQTREFAMVSWPVLMTLALTLARRGSESGMRLFAGVGVLAALAPAFFVWEGDVRSPGLYFGGHGPMLVPEVRPPPP